MHDVHRPPIHSARTTHSKETVVRSLRNFANATFRAFTSSGNLNRIAFTPVVAIVKSFTRIRNVVTDDRNRLCNLQDSASIFADGLRS